MMCENHTTVHGLLILTLVHGMVLDKEKILAEWTNRTFTTHENFVVEEIPKGIGLSPSMTCTTQKGQSVVKQDSSQKCTRHAIRFRVASFATVLFVLCVL